MRRRRLTTRSQYLGTFQSLLVLCHRPAWPFSLPIRPQHPRHRCHNYSPVHSIMVRSSSSSSNPSKQYSKVYSCDDSSDTVNDKDNNKHPNNSELLTSWCHHDSLDFHRITPSEAAEIREALLSWYRVERRPLPWRGDPPPWQGSSTSIVNFDKKSSKKSNTMTKTAKTTQKITDFFQISDNNKDKKDNSDNRDSSSTKDTTATTNSTTTTSETTNSTTTETKTTFPVTAYGVWVSEIMLQQTRVEAVIPYWITWMTSFPTVHHLAKATPEQVNAHWAGLGFYRRVRFLHTAAQQVVQNHDGKVPNTVDELLTLPGIGKYTAHAIASIAYNVPVPVVDGNVCRVLSRLRGIAQQIKATPLKDRHGWELAAAIVGGDGSTAGEVNQALMELGATYCAPSGTGIDPKDPLKDFYWSTKIAQAATAKKNGDYGTMLELLEQTKEQRAKASSLCPVCASNGVEVALDELATLVETSSEDPRVFGHRVLPLAPPKTTKREEVLAVAVLEAQSKKENDQQEQNLEQEYESRWLLVKRPSTGLLAGQWEFPSACVWNSAEQQPKTKGKSNKKANVQTVPIIPPKTRQRALNQLMQDELEVSDCLVTPQRSVEKESIEHIFSHVRHTLWLEHAVIEAPVHSLDPDLGDSPQSSSSVSNSSSLLKSWVSPSGQELRWMTRDEMRQVGITSGVQKILRRVQTSSSLSKNRRQESMTTLTKTKTKKRRRTHTKLE